MAHSRGFIIVCFALLIGLGVGSLAGYVMPLTITPEDSTSFVTPIATTSNPVTSTPVPDTVMTPPATAATTTPDTVMCTMDAMMCPDGSYVGRVAPSCAFAPCPEVTTTAETITCSPEALAAEVCTEEYSPVCALTQVECVTTPCPPQPQTYGNACSACASGRVTEYSVGACAGNLTSW